MLTLLETNIQSLRIPPPRAKADAAVERRMSLPLNAHEKALATILEEMRLDEHEIATVIEDVRFKTMQSHFQRQLGRALRLHEQNHLRQGLRSGAISDRWLDEICDGK